MNQARIARLAQSMGKLLEGERSDEAGAAIGLLLGTFIVGFGLREKEMKLGIEAIAEDAEDAAVKIYRARQ